MEQKMARNHEYEEALRRRDFRVVLWMIANGDVPANYETVGGEMALLAAISAKDVEAVKRIVAGYVIRAPADAVMHLKDFSSTFDTVYDSFAALFV